MLLKILSKHRSDGEVSQGTATNKHDEAAIHTDCTQDHFHGNNI